VRTESTLQLKRTKYPRLFYHSALECNSVDGFQSMNDWFAWQWLRVRLFHVSCRLQRNSLKSTLFANNDDCRHAT